MKEDKRKPKECNDQVDQQEQQQCEYVDAVNREQKLGPKG